MVKVVYCNKSNENIYKNVNWHCGNGGQYILFQAGFSQTHGIGNKIEIHLELDVMSFNRANSNSYLRTMCSRSSYPFYVV